VVIIEDEMMVTCSMYGGS